MVYEGFPLIIGWELTLACNLLCVHCGSSAGSARNNELTLDESLAICNQLPTLLVEEVNFTGGEPLLRPDWPAIVGHLNDLGIRTKILTNGLALKPDVVAELKNVGVEAVGVSLDGLEKNHDYIRGREGLFKSIITNIEKTQSAGLNVTIITTVNSLNVNDLPGIYDLIRSMDLRRWQIQPVFHFGRIYEAENLHLSEQAYLKLGTFIKEHWPSARKTGLEISPADSFGYFTELDPREPQWSGCGAGLYACGITSDGKVKGCLSLPDEIVEGDLRKNDLWDIWFANGAFAYTRDYRPEELGPNCRTCDKAAQCRGGCSAMSYSYTGKFHNDPFCFYNIRNQNNAPTIRNRQ